MLGMKWSWPALQATPMYVRRYCMDLLGIRAKCAAQRREGGQR
jgi:hypothetical protein